MPNTPKLKELERKRILIVNMLKKVVFTFTCMSKETKQINNKTTNSAKDSKLISTRTLLKISGFFSGPLEENPTASFAHYSRYYSISEFYGNDKQNNLGIVASK